MVEESSGQNSDDIMSMLEALEQDHLATNGNQKGPQDDGRPAAGREFELPRKRKIVELDQQEAYDGGVRCCNAMRFHHFVFLRTFEKHGESYLS